MTLIYNLNSISNWLTSLKDLKRKKDKIININIYGDSITIGIGAAVYNDMLGKWRFGYAGRIRETLKNIFQDVGRGVLPAEYFWTYTGTWSTWETNESEIMGRNFYKGERSPDYGFMGGSKQTDEENATATLEFTGTGLDVFIQQDNNGGTASVMIDSVAQEDIDCHNIISQPVKVSYSGLTNSKHRIVIIKSNDGKFIYILGAQEKNESSYGVNVNSMCLGGSEIRNIEPQNLELMASDTLFPADLTIINLVTNSYLTNSISNFTSQLDTIIEAVSGDVLIVSQAVQLSSARTTYNNSLNIWAEDNKVTLIDLYTEMNGNSALLSDNIHHNIAGHKWESNEILETIIPNSMQNLISRRLNIKMRNRLCLQPPQN